MNEAAFGKVETCACCGKDVKRPVTIKRFPGQFFGKDCRNDIAHVRSVLWMVGAEGEARAIESIKRDWPRTGDKLIAWAKR